MEGGKEIDVLKELKELKVYKLEFSLKYSYLENQLMEKENEVKKLELQILQNQNLTSLSEKCLKCSTIESKINTIENRNEQLLKEQALMKVNIKENQDLINKLLDEKKENFNTKIQNLKINLKEESNSSTKCSTCKHEKINFDYKNTISHDNEQQDDDMICSLKQLNEKQSLIVKQILEEQKDRFDKLYNEDLIKKVEELNQTISEINDNYYSLSQKIKDDNEKYFKEIEKKEQTILVLNTALNNLKIKYINSNEKLVKMTCELGKNFKELKKDVAMKLKEKIQSKI